MLKTVVIYLGSGTVCDDDVLMMIPIPQPVTKVLGRQSIFLLPPFQCCGLVKDFIIIIFIYAPRGA